MRTRATSFPGIVELYSADPSALPPVVALRAICGERITVLESALTPVAFYGVPVAELSVSNDRGNRTEEAKLTFSAPAAPDEGPLAFIARDVAGRCWLIGQAEQPFPAVNCKKSTGSPKGAPAVWEVEVTHSAPKTMIEIFTR